jgi:NCAIR mutase (PurE)-related protein
MAGALAGVVSVLVARTVIVVPVAISWPEGSAVIASLIAPMVTTALPPMIAAKASHFCG